MVPEHLSVGHLLWRKLPVAPRRAALQALASWRAPRADAVAPSQASGLVVVGELSQPTGLGAGARCLADALKQLGYGGYGVTAGVGQAPQGDCPPGAALLLAINAPSLPLMLARAGKNWLRDRLVIGSWAWELPVVPPSWAAGAHYVHEVWAPSPFVAASLETILPKRVKTVPYPLALCQFAQAPAPASLNLPTQTVVVVMVLSLGSSMARKNPLAGIAAFKQAFGNRPDVVLVVKIQGAAAFAQVAAILAAQASVNVKIVSAVWSQTQMDGLMSRADIVLSLHRAEGFGLVLAEAMLRGKAVVATGWSGNMAFMDDTSAALIDYQLVPVADESGIYTPMKGALWAQAQRDHAVMWLRRLGDDPALRQALGARARAYARRALGGEPLRAALVARTIHPL